MKIVEIEECFHVSRRTVNNWIDAGCPRNPDKTMSINQVHRWLLQRETGSGSLKDRKLEKEIEWKDAQIQKMRGEMVEKTLMETILASRASTLRLHLERSAVKNTVHYLGKTLPEMQTLRFGEVQEMMDAYIGNK